MFLRAITAKQRLKKISKIIFTGVLIIMFSLTLMACTPEGKIIILENGYGTGFTATFNDYTSENKCKLFLVAGDTVQVEVDHEEGKIMLTVSGKNGSQPYTGNDLKSGTFTVTVSETDEYIFHIKGNGATGKITVKNFNSEVE
jgi:hypothetical protein